MFTGVWANNIFGSGKKRKDGEWWMQRSAALEGEGGGQSLDAKGDYRVIAGGPFLAQRSPPPCSLHHSIITDRDC